MPNEDDAVQGGQLKSFIERIERLDEEAKSISDDKAEIYAEAKGSGFDPKVMKKVIAIRRRDPNERREEEAILELYLQAVGDDRDVAPTKAPSRVEQAAARTATPSSSLLPGDDDQAYLQVKAVVLGERNASASFVQRKFQIGFNRAARFLERMEDEGWISKPNHAGKREILSVEERVQGRLKDEALSMAQTLRDAGATMEVRAAPGSVFARAGEAVKAAGGPVVVKSFIPPAETAPDDDNDPFGS